MRRGQGDGGGVGPSAQVTRRSPVSANGDTAGHPRYPGARAFSTIGLMKTPVLNIDLHCHSTVSDGALAPRDVAQRAHANGVDVWALTDHDEVGGLAEAAAMAQELSLIHI